jgi:transcriptional regulator with XRE-family HTH domain
VTEQEHGEDFAQLIKRLKDEYQVSESEIARRLDVSIATVNNWVHRRRQAPRVATLDKIAEIFPKFTRREIFAAAGRQTPGELGPDAEQRIMENLRELTEEQQRMFDLQIRAVAEGNRSGAS